MSVPGNCVVVSTLDWKILSEVLLGGLPAGVRDGADDGPGVLPRPGPARATAAASSVWAWCTAASAEAIQSRTSSGGWGGNRWGVMPLPRVERRASQSAHSAIGP